MTIDIRSPYLRKELDRVYAQAVEDNIMLPYRPETLIELVSRLNVAIKRSDLNQQIDTLQHAREVLDASEREKRERSARLRQLVAEGWP